MHCLPHLNNIYMFGHFFIYQLRFPFVATFFMFNRVVDWSELTSLLPFTSATNEAKNLESMLKIFF